MSPQINNKINDDAIRKLFKDKNLVFISTLMKDGLPQVTPTWVDIENGTILVTTAMGRITQEYLTRSPCSISNS